MNMKINIAKLHKVNVPYIDTKFTTTQALSVLVILGFDQNLKVKYGSKGVFGGYVNIVKVIKVLAMDTDVPAPKFTKHNLVIDFLDEMKLNKFGLIKILAYIKILLEWEDHCLVFEKGLDSSLACLKALTKFIFEMRLTLVALSALISIGFFIPTMIENDSLLGYGLVEKVIFSIARSKSFPFDPGERGIVIDLKKRSSPIGVNVNNKPAVAVWTDDGWDIKYTILSPL
ncbi:K(+) efflux antiporter 3, chloroplastic [Senna tora]|uniref:K(+) efflux antiporter 3, chloroplastic n=1 Tax=Senna tora TaxID=362788 RepID=A0A835CF32_9FABA|nr:K(+) efflux antiporter 3, chloroplastic [Senna tora]